MPKLLVVEDDVDLRDVLHDIARELGFETNSTSSFEEALSRLQTGEVDVAVIDCFLGGETCERMLGTLADRASTRTGVVLISASPAMAQLATRWSLPFLAKPFELEALADAIRSAQLAPARPKRPSL